MPPELCRTKEIQAAPGSTQRRAPVPAAPGVALEQPCKVTAGSEHPVPAHSAGRALARGDSRQEQGGLRTAGPAGGQRPAPRPGAVGPSGAARSAPGPGGQRRGNRLRGGPGGLPGAAAAGSGQSPAGRAPREGRPAGPAAAMGTRRALTAAAAASAPARDKIRARRGRAALSPRGLQAANREPRTARAGDLGTARGSSPLRRRLGREAAHAQKPLVVGGLRGKSRDGPDPAPTLTWLAPPKVGGRSANARMRKQRCALATRTGGRGKMAAALRYRWLYWRLQPRHPAQLPSSLQGRGDTRTASEGAEGTRPWTSLGCSSPWAEEGSSAPLNTGQELLLTFLLQALRWSVCFTLVIVHMWAESHEPSSEIHEAHSTISKHVLSLPRAFPPNTTNRPCCVHAADLQLCALPLPSLHLSPLGLVLIKESLPAP